LNKAAVKITAMVSDDLDEVMRIEQDSFAYPWSKNSFQGEILSNRFAYYVTAKDISDSVIGYAGAWIILDEAHITTLAVDPSCRQMGTGSLLLAHLLRKAIEEGACKVFLEVRDSNRQARRIYERFGFEVIGKRKRYYHDEDALVMVRALEKVKG